MNAIPQSAPRAASNERTKTILMSILRILLGGILLSVLVAGCLYLHHTAFSFFRTRMLEEEHKTTAWFVKEIGYALPWMIISIFQGIVYHKHDRRDGMAQWEMMWQIVVVAVMTYAVLLPYLSHLSESMYNAAVEAGAIVPETDGGVPWTLMLKLHEWFVRLPIPLGILGLFHGMRASRERENPDTEEPLMTVEEYNALHNTDEESTALTETEAAHVQAKK